MHYCGTKDARDTRYCNDLGFSATASHCDEWWQKPGWSTLRSTSTAHVVCGSDETRLPAAQAPGASLVGTGSRGCRGCVPSTCMVKPGGFN